MTFIYFIIALGILIFIHELGHFAVAKRQGICVEVFSFGFGPKIFGIKRGDTDYRVSALPLGGYVRMKGEDPEEEDSHAPDSFSAKGVWPRAKVIVTGPLMDLALALVLMPLVFMMGRSEPAYLAEAPVLVGVVEDSPAALSGLKKGDRIVAIDGKRADSWEDVVGKVLLSAGSALDIKIDRGGMVIERRIAVEEMPDIKGGYIGIDPIYFMGGGALVGGVASGGPAGEAGIRPGDEVVSFAGREVESWLGLAKAVNRNGAKDAKMVVEREGERLTFTVKPVLNEDFGRFMIGITEDRKGGVPMQVRRYGFAESVARGVRECARLVGMTFTVIWRLVTLKLSYKVLGGPIVIAQVSAAAAALGLSNFIYFLAFLSIQLSVLNLLPVPVLDGGHLVFLGIEAARRRPVSTKIRSIANQVGFVVLVSLMLLITFNDADRVWGVREMLGRIF